LRHGAGATALAGLIARLRSLAGFAVFVPLGPPLLLSLLFLLPSRRLRVRLSNAVSRVFSALLLHLWAVRVELDHEERLSGSTPALYIANHSSSLDTFLLMALAPMGVCMLVKREAIYLPIFGQAALLSGYLCLDREAGQEAHASMARTAAFVRDNELGLFLMPEGTRSRDGQLGPFKKGFVHLAVTTGLPVVPIAIRGAASLWPLGSWWIRPGAVRVEVLPRIDTSEWRAEQAGLHAEQVRELLAGALS